MNRRKILRATGNFFVIGGILLLAYIYYPIIRIYVNPPVHSVYSDQKIGTFIEIPKINVQSSIITNVDPFHEQEYQEALKRGVAHAKNTVLPGEDGMMFLFAHSSGPPWQQTRNNTIFLKLGQLEKGDSIIITKNGKDYLYIVREKKEVWPHEVNYLLDNKRDELILQTCTPIGTDLKRLLVFADPQF